MPRQIRTDDDPATRMITANDVDNKVALDGSRKRYCVGCAGLRDVPYAETHACGCCGRFGTQKTMPEFDEDGDPIAPAAPKAKPAQVIDEVPLVVRPIGGYIGAEPKPARVKKVIDPDPVVTEIIDGDGIERPVFASDLLDSADAIVADYPTSDAAKAIKLARSKPFTEVTEKIAKAAPMFKAVSLAAMFAGGFDD